MNSCSCLEPVCCSMSSSNCCFLTCIQISLIRWSGMKREIHSPFQYAQRHHAESRVSEQKMDISTYYLISNLSGLSAGPQETEQVTHIWTFKLQTIREAKVCVHMSNPVTQLTCVVYTVRILLNERLCFCVPCWIESRNTASLFQVQEVQKASINATVQRQLCC